VSVFLEALFPLSHLLLQGTKRMTAGNAISRNWTTIAFFALLAGVSAVTMIFAPPWEHGVVISLKAEPIAHVGHFIITNTILASTLVVLGFVVFAWLVRRKNHNLHSRFYNIVEMVVEGLLGLVQGTVGKKVGKQIFAIIATFLLFIVVNNWFGVTPIVGSIGVWEEHHTEVQSPKSKVQNDEELAHKNSDGSMPTADRLPLAASAGVGEVSVDEEHSKASGENEMIFVPLFRSANSDLNMTLAIALISVAVIQIVAIRNIGTKSYLKTFFNFSSPIMFGVGLLEIISEIVKVFSFSFRLFGNIFAGDVLLIVIASLVPFLGPVPFIGIELFAGLIQAVVFSMLSMVFLQSHLSHAEAH